MCPQKIHFPPISVTFGPFNYYLRFTKLNKRFTEQINGLPNSDLEYKMMLSTKYTVYQTLLYINQSLEQEDQMKGNPS